MKLNLPSSLQQYHGKKTSQMNSKTGRADFYPSRKMRLIRDRLVVVVVVVVVGIDMVGMVVMVLYYTCIDF